MCQSSSFVDRLQQGNYFHRMPRIPPYQTTPFTIDPSARSTQTFAERYGVSPPHSPEDTYGYKSKSSDSKSAKRNQKASKASKEHQTTVIKEGNSEQNNKSLLPNSTTAFDVELLQVSSVAFNYDMAYV
jgi:FKBP-type peptidyl-prolyl cis-trans isomerase